MMKPKYLKAEVSSASADFSLREQEVNTPLHSPKSVFLSLCL